MFAKSKSKSRKMPVLLGLLLLWSGVAVAQDTPLLITNSRSPNGKAELWIKPPKEDEGVASGTAQIREVKTGKIVGTFEWSGFGVRADSDAFIVLWRADCKFFAIKYEQSRGWRSGAIYGLHNGGRWAEVKLPDTEYDKAIKKLAGVSEFYGKGCDAPEKWLPNGDLMLIFADRNVVYDHEDLFKEFEVTLRVTDQKGQSLPVAKIVSIKQKSKKETERELQTQ